MAAWPEILYGYTKHLLTAVRHLAKWVDRSVINRPELTLAARAASSGKHSQTSKAPWGSSTLAVKRVKLEEFFDSGLSQVRSRT